MLLISFKINVTVQDRHEGIFVSSNGFVYHQSTVVYTCHTDNLNFELLVSKQVDSVAEWLECWTRAQKGLGSNRSRDAVG